MDMGLESFYSIAVIGKGEFRKMGQEALCVGTMRWVLLLCPRV
jgi:hypothetical protein